MKKKITLINPITENKISISKPEPNESIKSFFLFSAHKAGSTLLTNLFSQYCQKTKIPTIDISSAVYNEGEVIQNMKLADKGNEILANGYGYIGWRSYWEEIQKTTLEQSNNILLVRDPRDRIVSLYYSLAFSHVIPSKGVGLKNAKQQRNNALKHHDINEWILHNPDTVKSIDIKIQDYIKKLPFRSTRIYRYEDVIFRKAEWMIDMMDYLNLKKSKWQIRRVVKKNDVIPTNEMKENHIRQVTPGNYLKHLNIETIKSLNIIFEDQLKLFNYFDVDSSFNNRGICFAHEGQESKKILRE